MIEEIKKIIEECEENQKSAPHQISKDVLKIEAYYKIKKVTEGKDV